MKYPDISHYHPVKSWEEAKENCGFLISKATQGTGFVDSTLDSFIRGCEKHEIPYWLYTFMNKGNELAQAKFMVKTCKGKVGPYFRGYILDVEQKNDAANVKSALDYLKKQSEKTMIYTMYADYSRYKNVIAGRGSDCAWWEARYGLNLGSYSGRYPAHAGVDLHQYTSRGKCPGISGRADLNRLTGTKKLSWFTDAVKKAAASKSDDKKESDHKADDKKIAVDGSWGKETTKAAQKVFKTQVDGIVSRQPWDNRNYLPACSLSSWEFFVTSSKTKGGSALIRAIQTMLNMGSFYDGERDGWCGPKTVSALQRFLDIEEDGYCGEKTVAAFQRYINKKII